MPLYLHVITAILLFEHLNLEQLNSILRNRYVFNYLYVIERGHFALPGRLPHPTILVY